MLITNQTHWEVTRVLRGYRGRWTGTADCIRKASSIWGWVIVKRRGGEGEEAARIPRPASCTVCSEAQLRPPVCECVGSGEADDHWPSLSGRPA